MFIGHIVVIIGIIGLVGLYRGFMVKGSGLWIRGTGFRALGSEAKPPIHQSSSLGGLGFRV